MKSSFFIEEKFSSFSNNITKFISEIENYILMRLPMILGKIRDEWRLEYGRQLEFNSAKIQYGKINIMVDSTDVNIATDTVNINEEFNMPEEMEIPEFNTNKNNVFSHEFTKEHEAILEGKINAEISKAMEELRLG